ncbi:MAG: hypothetical protein ACR2F9_04450 [Longimicrobiaceae bacterium]
MARPPRETEKEEGGAPLPDSPPCPFCDASESELVSPFGGALSVAQYWCRRCRTGFEYLKWGERDGEHSG